ncbi:MAG TPA: Gfo/Idh/MocA family oxidoreductase, partial [Armatimonadota bacterium]
MGEKIRAVLAGCGGISNAWLGSEAMKAGAEIVGLVDLNPEAARAKAEQHGWAQAAIGTELGRMLDDTHPEVVFDCTVPSAHINVTLEALRHGCHVLGEKPLADTLEHAREMVAAAQQAGKLYVVMQNRRYDARIRRLRAFLDSGAIGKVTTVQSNFFLGADFGPENFRTHMRHVLILDMAIHTFDAARFLMGATPLSVYCHEWNPSGSWYDYDASALAHFEMSDGV